MRRVLLCVLVGVVGCKSERLKTTEAELTAARARLAAMDARRADMVKELNAVEAARRKAARDADAAEYAITRLSGALQVLEGKPVPDGLLLDDALKTKSPELGRLAATIVQRQLPCVEANAADEEADKQQEQECRTPEVPDACEGVPPRTVQDFSWSCTRLAETKGAPTIAICSSPLTGHDDVGALRLAFLHEGRVIVGDFPAPSSELYTPENTSERNACNAENLASSCESTCDDRFGRNGCYDPYEGGDGYVGEEEDNDEPAELVAARREAAQAAEAARQAEDELAYQECRANCAADPTEEDALLASTMEYVATVSPGVFHFHNRTGPDADGGYDEGDAIISFPTYNQVLADNFETDEDDVQGLSLELYSDEGFVTSKPADGALLMAGCYAQKVNGIRVFVDGKKPVEALNTADTCAFVERMKNKRLTELCAKQLADELERAAKRAAADAGVVDAGVPVFDGGVDAGGAP